MRYYQADSYAQAGGRRPQPSEPEPRPFPGLPSGAQYVGAVTVNIALIAVVGLTVWDDMGAVVILGGLVSVLWWALISRIWAARR